MFPHARAYGRDQCGRKRYRRASWLRHRPAAVEHYRAYGHMRASAAALHGSGARAEHGIAALDRARQIDHRARLCGHRIDCPFLSGGYSLVPLAVRSVARPRPASHAYRREPRARKTHPGNPMPSEAFRRTRHGLRKYSAHPGPIPGQMWPGVSPVPVQMWPWGEPRPGADVARGEPSPGADVGVACEQKALLAQLLLQTSILSCSERHSPATRVGSADAERGI